MASIFRVAWPRWILILISPKFTMSLDGAKPKITSGGWAKEATVHQLPIMDGIAGVHMLLDPGAARELHRYALAEDWAYVIDAQCQTVVLAL